MRAKADQRLLSVSSSFLTPCRRSAQASRPQATSTGHIKTGEGFRNRDAVRFASVTYRGTGQLFETKTVDQGQESLHGQCRSSKMNIEYIIQLCY